MRWATLTICGVLLFAAGAAAGFLVRGSAWGDRPGPAPGSGGAPGFSVPEPKKDLPSLEEDRRALRGLWVQPGVANSPRVLNFHERFVGVCDFTALVASEAKFNFGFDLAEADGKRRLVDEYDGVTLFTYRLDGDTLELHWEAPKEYPDHWDLTGKWFRFTGAP